MKHYHKLYTPCQVVFHYLLMLYSLLYKVNQFEPLLPHYLGLQEKIHLQRHQCLGLYKPSTRIGFMFPYITRIHIILCLFLILPNSSYLAYHVLYAAVSFFLSNADRVPKIDMYDTTFSRCYNVRQMNASSIFLKM